MLAKKGSKTGHVLAPARPQLGRLMPCEHSKWRIGKGMGGQRIRPAAWCSRRGASKIRGEQSELRCFGCSIHPSAWKGYSANFGGPIGPDLIHHAGSLFTTTTCSSRPCGARGLRSHPRGPRRASYAGSCK